MLQSDSKQSLSLSLSLTLNEVSVVAQVLNYHRKTQREKERDLYQTRSVQLTLVVSIRPIWEATTSQRRRKSIGARPRDSPH